MCTNVFRRDANRARKIPFESVEIEKNETHRAAMPRHSLQRRRGERARLQSREARKRKFALH
jgi:hypothetical protein